MSIEILIDHPYQKKELWQWEQGRRVSVSVECDEVHFASLGDDDAVICEVREESGWRTAEIPNMLLMKPKGIQVWAMREGAVVAFKRFAINLRPMPSTYVYVPTKVVTIESIKDDIKKELMLYVDERVDEAVEERVESLSVPTASLKAIAALFDKGGES